MTTSLVPGWTVDLPDPSVGIFGEPEFFHDDCPATVDPVHAEFEDPTPAHVTRTVREVLPSGEAIVDVKLECQDCDHVTTFEDRELT